MYPCFNAGGSFLPLCEALNHAEAGTHGATDGLCSHGETVHSVPNQQ